MRILVLETSTEWCSVAVGDGTRWHARDELAGQAHSERALALCAELLAEAQWPLASLDGIAFGAGPGSFTGIRIACGLAQGLALSGDLPVVPVPTLAALAQSAWTQGGHSRVFACLDARMREVYVAAYARAGAAWEEVAAPAVLAPAAVTCADGAAWFGAFRAGQQQVRLAHVVLHDGEVPVIRVLQGPDPAADALQGDVDHRGLDGLAYGQLDRLIARVAALGLQQCLV